ncbi:MAG TPA: FAD-dependent oxidoreductase [Opitutaceae bacterium]|jgi:glycine/D-amino acid oxidase-like deaminating enzyme/nitrite reductase/ring-hydroxylating ferredoxin subunit|nr:FAD-dependent oxidoreductase [Opitutaceae bacterium]
MRAHPKPETAGPSHWLRSAPFPRFPRLDRDLAVDVAVIGAGITGLTAAYLLRRAGLSVAVLDRARAGGVDTMSTTGHLTSVTDERLHTLARRFGPAAARAVWDAGGAAIDHIDACICREGLHCNFAWVPGFLHSAVDRPGGSPSRPALADLESEAASAADLGIPSHFLGEVPFWKVPGVKFPHQALFHPRKYLAGVARAFHGPRGLLFEHSAADEIKVRPQEVRSGPHRVRCGYIVLATHTPLMGKTPLLPALLLQTKLFLYSSYAVGARLPAGTIPAGMYWDTRDPYYYLRVESRRGHDYAIFGGADHKTGQADSAAAIATVKARLRQFAPRAKIDSQWSGQVIQTPDGLPFIGETGRRQFAATGYSGNGLTFGTLGGMMAADAVLGRSNPWRALFDMHRKPLHGGLWTYLKENKDYPYYMARDWLGPAQGSSLRSLRPGQGKVLKLGGRKVAAHRDAAGNTTLCSAVCTHLQGIVAWNAAESTWDCPCHGSRFSPTGAVISGPAEEPLERIPEAPGSK